MHALPLRIFVGLALMVGACWFSYRRGDGNVRRVVGLIAVCWTLSIATQLVTGHTAEPSIAADVICGLVFLRWVWRGGPPWLWAFVVLESFLLVLHGVLYESGAPPTPLEIVGNNVLVTLALVILVVVALASPPRKD